MTHLKQLRSYFFIKFLINNIKIKKTLSAIFYLTILISQTKKSWQKIKFVLTANI